MIAPSLPSHRSRSLPAFVLLVIAACGGRASGVSGSGSNVAVSSGLSPGTVSGTSVGASTGANSGRSGGSGVGVSTGLASGASADSGSGSASGTGSDAGAGTDSGNALAPPCPDNSSDAGPVAPPSCALGGPGMTNCGASGESCCTSLEVTGGTYYRTYDEITAPGGSYTFTLAADGGPTGEADPATVSCFRLDKYLVTVGRFRQFVNAVLASDGGAGWVPSSGSGKHTYLNGGNGLNATGGGYEPGWVATDDSNIAPTNANLSSCAPYSTWTNTAASQENLPINCVNWRESYAFCIWDGGFLPSEAEWEYAAAGGSQQREYPWGSTAPGTANEYAIYGCYYPSDSRSCRAVGNIAPVGTATAGAGLWGQLDMAGEMAEWTLDWYAPYVDPCTDCADFAAGILANRVFRGGNFGFTIPSSLLLPPDRGLFFPSSGRGDDVGFRCARAP